MSSCSVFNKWPADSYDCLPDSVEIYLDITNVLTIPLCGFDSVKLVYNGNVLEGHGMNFELRIPIGEFNANAAILEIIGFKSNNKFQAKRVKIIIKEWGVPLGELGLSNISNGDSISIKHFMANLGIHCRISDPISSFCTVLNYNFTVLRNNEAIFHEKVFGPVYSQDIMDFMDSLKIGDAVKIDSISVKCLVSERDVCSSITHYIKP